MFEVQLAHDIVERSLAGAVGGAGDRKLIHVGDRGDAGGDGYKLRLYSRILEERIHGLEEDQRTNGIDLKMDFYFFSGRGDGGAPVVGYACVCDDHVEVRDGMFREAGDSGGWVSGGEGVDLHDDNLAAGGGDNGLESSALGDIADSCDDGIVGTLSVLSNKSETDA